MQRRDFLKTGLQTASAGAALSIPIHAAPAATEASATEAVSPASALAAMNGYTAADHRRRLHTSTSRPARSARPCANNW